MVINHPSNIILLLKSFFKNVWIYIFKHELDQPVKIYKYILFYTFFRCSNSKSKESFIQFRVQRVVSIHSTQSSLTTEGSTSRIVSRRDGMNRRRVPTIIHRGTSIAGMWKRNVVLTIALEYSYANDDR